MDNNLEIPFYQMNLQELKAYFTQKNERLDRKRKTRRRLKTKRRTRKTYI